MPVRWFIEGGPTMYPLCLVFAVGLPLTLVRLALHRKTTFPGLTAALLGVVLGLGLTGTFMGIVQVLDATAHAAPGTKQALLRVGLEIARNPVVFAAVLCAALVPPHLLAAIRERRPSDRWWGAAVAMSVPVLAVLGVATVAGIVALASFLELAALYASATADVTRELLLTQRCRAAVMVGVVASPLAVTAALLTGVGSLGAAVLAWVHNNKSAQGSARQA